jgi:hypothetical protein
MRRISPDDLRGIERDFLLALGPVPNNDPVDSRNQLPDSPLTGKDPDLGTKGTIAAIAVGVLLSLGGD